MEKVELRIPKHRAITEQTILYISYELLKLISYCQKFKTNVKKILKIL